jgi:NTE family protein
MMIGISLENLTSNDFRVQLAGRYLAYDVFGSGTELRIDGVVGSDPSAGFSFYRPLFGTRLFTRPYAAVEKETIDIVQEDVVLAEYRLRRIYAGADLGVNLSRVSELTGGVRIGHVDAAVRAGDPQLPEVNGEETQLRVRFYHDGQDNPVVPSGGTFAQVRLVHYLSSPETEGVERTNDDATQLEGRSTTFWSWRRRNRLFLVASAGTSFDSKPISRFALGYPFRLDAYNVGERRGDHYGVLTAGFLHQVGRLPDFMGGPVFIGTWLENGSAFDSDEDADFNTQAAFGIVMDSLIGPFVAGTSVGIDGGWRAFIAIGRLFR